MNRVILSTGCLLVLVESLRQRLRSAYPPNSQRACCLQIFVLIRCRRELEAHVRIRHQCLRKRSGM